jgi:uncharacterized membrane protein YedE/YeeE
MAGAILVAAAGFRFASGLPKPILAPRFSEPARGGIDARLVTGAAVFGVGWGLVGYCPGPALASLGFGHWQSPLFVAAMIAGTVAAKSIGHVGPLGRSAS